MPADATTQSDRKSAILAAALKVFSSRGFDAGTIREIAAEAGVAEGLIYHYFAGKDELLAELIEQRSLLPWLDEEGPHLLEAPLEEGLRLLVAEATRRLQANAENVLLMWSQVPTNDGVAQRLGRVVKRGMEWIARYLEAKIAAGELRPLDAEVAARLIMGTLITSVVWRERMTPPLPKMAPERLAEGLLEMLRGLPPPEGNGGKSRRGGSRDAQE